MYILYDVYGNNIAEGYSDQDVVDNASRRIYIPYKFVNKAELFEYPNRKFNELVSNGMYAIYKIQYNSINMYFRSYEKAYNAYKKQFIKWDDYYIKTDVEYTFKHLHNNEHITYRYKNSEEIRKIAEQI